MGGGRPAVRELWEMMNGWVFAGFDQTYKALGITFDKVYYEHETYLLGKELVQRGLDMGVFVKDPDGSVWCDLTADGLDRKLLLRSDGTSVYITQDLGTAERRFSEYKLDSHIYVVGDEQNYHFQVLKLILKKLGFDWADQIFHLSYGMVELPEGKMKSREGTVVDADDLIEKMYEEAKATSEESGKLEGISDEEKERLYRMIGLGALKYFILKVDPKKKMLFNPKESIDFNGNTGPFIQYTHARICSILRKAAEQGILAATLNPDVELSPKGGPPRQAPERLSAEGGRGRRGVLSRRHRQLCYDLAKEFNQYYHETPILKEPDGEVLRMRLVLIDHARLRPAPGPWRSWASTPDRMYRTEECMIPYLRQGSRAAGLGLDRRHHLSPETRSWTIPVSARPASRGTWRKPGTAWRSCRSPTGATTCGISASWARRGCISRSTPGRWIRWSTTTRPRSACATTTHIRPRARRGSGRTVP